MEHVETAAGLGSAALDAGISIGGVIAKVTPTDRHCSVTITNKCSRYSLRDPRVHTQSGKCFDPLPPVIEASSSGNGLFKKTPNTARGAVGVFTYDLYNNSSGQCVGRMAVMYKVPFNLNMKQNACALGVVDVSTECDKHLFRRMSKGTDQDFSREKGKGPSLTHSGDFVTIRANMSDCYTPTIKIQVSEN
uniref:DELTA-sagatoxin-Srs1a n=1 Tax=Periophthalmus magnuspinnatus TaxID=409849 RepID=A0A3B4A5R2_9GOBI